MIIQLYASKIYADYSEIIYQIKLKYRHSHALLYENVSKVYPTELNYINCPYHSKWIVVQESPQLPVSALF